MPSISDTFSPEQRIVLHEGDSLEFLKSIPDDITTLIITSPPFNIDKEYEIKTSIESYLEQQEPVIGELVRILRDKGSLCWEVGNFVKNSEVFPLDIFYYDIFKKKGLKLRNRIIWHFLWNRLEEKLPLRVIGALHGSLEAPNHLSTPFYQTFF